MSGLISSFLVEPLRRRLSHQPSVPSSPVEPNQAESPPNPREAAFRLNRHDNIDFGVAPGERYSRIGQSSRHADLALGSQCLQDEDSFQSGQNKDEYRQDGALIDIPAQGEVFGHPVNSAAPIVGHDGGADSGLPPENGFEMYEIGAQLALPEDDGMGKLRARIHAIRDLDVTGPQKAYLIHNVMTERYYTSRGGSASHSRPTESSPPDLRNLEQSGVPNYGAEERQDQFSMNPASTTTIIQQSNPYNLTREDLAPTYFPKADQDPQACDGEDIETEEFEEACLGCEHYKRNVKLQCYTCKKWYTCRFCHDAVEDHHLIRRETENMLCMLCGHAQPAAQWCIECGEQTAQYHCGVCKLWDNDSKKTIYHCNDCGICRIGQGLGKDFFHCRTCSVCLPISIENTHRCIERSTQCDCPICGDYMFTSPETVVVMRCGHSIHHRCLSEYSKSSYRCPICSKTITNMESTFRNLDRTIESQPMPAEFKDTKALVYCNDCGAKSIVRYHWLGLRCDLCESYNTAQIRLLHGDVLDSFEPDSDARSVPGSGLRSPSYGEDEGALSPALASLQINTSSVPVTGSYSRLNSPLSAEPNGQFASYSLSRDRAVSPVISNYFGLPPDRESERSKSRPHSGNGLDKDDLKDKDGEFHIWGAKLKYRYGFLGEEAESIDELSENDEEGYEEMSEESASEEEQGEEEEEEEEEDGIDIFGHR